MSRQYVTHLIQTFEDNGSVSNKKHDSARPIRNDAVEVAILGHLLIYDRQSLRKITFVSGVSKSSSQRIFKKHKFYPCQNWIKMIQIDVYSFAISGWMMKRVSFTIFSSPMEVRLRWMVKSTGIAVVIGLTPTHTFSKKVIHKRPKKWLFGQAFWDLTDPLIAQTLEDYVNFHFLNRMDCFSTILYDFATF